uniref:Uncharacterized protein n=1 Tax=Sphaerodactylus townsendi TaxID=933632 RepID=A0ACB8E5H7_9SAUR
MDSSPTESRRNLALEHSFWYSTDYELLKERHGYWMGREVYVPDDFNATLGRTANKQVFEGLTTGILRIVAVVLGCLISSVPYGNNQTCAPKLLQEMKSKTSPVEAFNTRIQDLISYVGNIGLIEKLSCCFLSVQGPIDENPKIAAFLQNATAALQGLCQLCFAVNGRSWSIFDNSHQDPTGFTVALAATDLVGVLHMLYCILFHGTIADASAASPKESYVENTIQVALHSLRLFNSFAVLDLPAFQSIVGAEGLSLAFRHIVNSLLWHCSQHTCEALLHEVIICVGYFTVNHPDNQGLLTALFSSLTPRISGTSRSSANWHCITLFAYYLGQLIFS